jgi:hypothetical protein
MIKDARNGGSITPRYRKILDAHVANGKVSLHTYTTLETVCWNSISKSWSVAISAADANLPLIDYIVFATGIQADIRTIPFLHTLQAQHPVEVIGGLPCLNEDLMWNDNVPLFVTGRLAGLRLGPGAPNLVGARIGAERIAWNVEDVLKKMGRGRKEGEHEVGNDIESSDEKMKAYATARDNRFDSLAGIEEDWDRSSFARSGYSTHDTVMC